MKNIKIFIFLLILMGCSETTKYYHLNLPDTIKTGCYVLCEGLYGQNNSSLSVINFENNEVINNYFFKKNNKKIGDTGNDLLIIGDTSFIVVSSNNKIIAFHSKTGKLLKEIYSNKFNTPRKITQINDSLIAVTNLKGNSITFINFKSLEVLDNAIQVGPAPEGITVSKDYIFVANSGYGDYLSSEPDAGTVYVIEKNSLSLKKKFENLPNVIQLEYNEQSNKLYARYNNLPSLKDSLGGIVEFDLNKFKEERRWELKIYYFTINQNSNLIYYLNDYGIGRIDLSNGLIDECHIKNSSSNNVWYTIFYEQKNDKLYVTNAKNYQSLGEIIIFNAEVLNEEPVKYKLGLNPNVIGFF